MDLTNSIERFIRELNRDYILSTEYCDVYSQYVDNEKLVYVFSSIHALMTSNFECMNQRLPTYDFEAHFWADPSRSLLKAINLADRLIRTLKSTSYACSYDDYYSKIISLCKSFLSSSGGSTIPQNVDTIELYYTIPIFSFSNSISSSNNSNIAYPMQAKGHGSYADVFVYHDEYYNIKFAVKRAHKNLTAKELARFKQEFDTMKSLSSPYILEVYTYDESKNQYLMEYMDKTLDEYIQENNTKLSLEQRKTLVFQVLRAFNYLHSKNILHRDISPKNVLLKIYEDTIVIKIADFGLVKIPDSTLTSENTDLKGYFNDPALVIEGFSNYGIEHETYALTRLVSYILTGKINLDKVKDEKISKFINKGLNADKTIRYSNVNEIRKAFLEIF